MLCMLTMLRSPPSIPGVHDAAQILGLGRVRLQLPALAQLYELIKGQHLQRTAGWVKLPMAGAVLCCAAVSYAPAWLRGL